MNVERLFRNGGKLIEGQIKPVRQIGERAQIGGISKYILVFPLHPVVEHEEESFFPQIADGERVGDPGKKREPADVDVATQGERVGKIAAFERHAAEFQKRRRRRKRVA